MVWHATCSNTLALPSKQPSSGKGPVNKDPVSRRQEVARKATKKELAPGGHQEQGESRVTVFRAPDSEKHQVSKWRVEPQLPL